MFPLKFDIKLFLALSLAFILSTIIGTLSHEFGHYAVAKSLGYSSKIGYGYSTWNDSTTTPFIDSIYSKYPKEFLTNSDFPEKKEFDLINNKLTKDSFWIKLGGPIQTMMTGTIGLILLLNQRRKIVETKTIKLYQWLCIFLALFWLRPLANLGTWIIGYLLNGKFTSNGDEVQLAISLNIPKGTIAISTATIGLAVLMFIILKIIPIDKRITFISGGLFGGILGYLFWLVWVGPILMP